MNIYFEALKKIKKYNKIIIHRHTNPDGDAIGSQVGLKELISLNFPHKKVFIVGDNPGRYGFVDGSCPDHIDDSEYEGALAIVLDSAEAKLVSDNRFLKADETIRFDHHIFCSKMCSTEIIDQTFESCCSMIVDFSIKTKMKMNTKAATAFYIGIVTDSGRFRFDSTSSKTFRIASELMKYNIDTGKIYSSLYKSSLDAVKTRADFLSRMKTTENNVAYVFTTYETVKKHGTDPHKYSRAYVNSMSDIEDIHIWVSFTEGEHNVLCEIRSDKYNINPIAVKYGGGGHAKASGTEVNNYDEAMLLLADLDFLASGDPND